LGGEMKEIKFRAWDKKMKRFIDMSNCVTLVKDINNTNCCEFLQYTGLRDCNGVEIYEGDIIGGIYDCFIKWCDDCNCFNLFALWDKSLCMQCDGNITWLEFVQDCEKVVIGNIHENPELLEEATK